MKSLLRFLPPFLLPIAVALAVFVLSPAHRRRPNREHPGGPAAGARVDLSAPTPAESEAISRALAAVETEKGFPALRVARDDDASPSPDRDDLEDLYGSYHPYFVRGDLNGDGRLDFAQAFVEKGPAGWFHVAVFFGKPGGGFEPPVWVERGVSLAAGDLSIDRSLLIVVPDLSFDETRRWRWDATERRFVDADAGAPLRGESEGLDPDGKPRVRI